MPILLTDHHDTENEFEKYDCMFSSIRCLCAWQQTQRYRAKTVIMQKLNKHKFHVEHKFVVRCKNTKYKRNVMDIWETWVTNAQNTSKFCKNNFFYYFISTVRQVIVGVYNTYVWQLIAGFLYLLSVHNWLIIQLM